MTSSSISGTVAAVASVTTVVVEIVRFVDLFGEEDLRFFGLETKVVPDNISPSLLIVEEEEDDDDFVTSNRLVRHRIGSDRNISLLYLRNAFLGERHGRK
jgi:hypothetical protein